MHLCVIFGWGHKAKYGEFIWKDPADNTEGSGNSILIKSLQIWSD